MFQNSFLYALIVDGLEILKMGFKISGTKSPRGTFLVGKKASSSSGMFHELARPRGGSYKVMNGQAFADATDKANESIRRFARDARTGSFLNPKK